MVAETNSATELQQDLNSHLPHPPCPQAAFSGIHMPLAHNQAGTRLSLSQNRAVAGRFSLNEASKRGAFNRHSLLRMSDVLDEEELEIHEKKDIIPAEVQNKLNGAIPPKWHLGKDPLQRYLSSRLLSPHPPSAAACALFQSC